MSSTRSFDSSPRPIAGGHGLQLHAVVSQHGPCVLGSAMSCSYVRHFGPDGAMELFAVQIVMEGNMAATIAGISDMAPTGRYTPHFGTLSFLEMHRRSYTRSSRQLYI